MGIEGQMTVLINIMYFTSSRVSSFPNFQRGEKNNKTDLSAISSEMGVFLLFFFCINYFFLKSRVQTFQEADIVNEKVSKYGFLGH